MAILNNWKTTLAGLAILGLIAGLLMGKVTPDQFITAFATIAAGGFLAAKDSAVASPTVVTTEMTAPSGAKTTVETKTETGA